MSKYNAKPSHINTCNRNPSEADGHLMLMKKIPSGSWKFITIFTKVYHCNLSWVCLIQFIPSLQLSKIHVNTILAMARSSSVQYTENKK